MTTRPILALGAAPAIVRADALMRIVPRDAPLIVADLGQIDEFKLMVIQVTAPTRKLNVRWLEPDVSLPIDLGRAGLPAEWFRAH